MKILEIRAMKGPNYWSIRRHKLIVMKLDLEEMEDRPTNTIPGFGERLQQLLPGMYEHRCSEGVPGGFFTRVKDGTWMGHVIEHIALEIQSLAGMECGFGRTRGTGEHGVYHVVFDYIEEKAGIYAARAATDIAISLIDNLPIALEPIIQKLREIREAERLGPSTASIVNEALRRNIPFIRLNRHSLVQLGYGVNQKRIRATIASTTGNIAVDIAGDKEETKNLLSSAGVPVPKGDSVYDEEDLEKAVHRLGYPLAIKPRDGNHGKGATINIESWEKAVQAFQDAKKYSRWVMVEQFIEGFDHRLLVINYKFVAAAKRTPACVVGDGVSTIAQLVEETNKDPRRGYGHEKVLTYIELDAMSMKILAESNLSPESVLPAGEVLYLKTTANLSTGGTSTDVTDIVHPYNIFMAERIARIIGLDICGIDLMTPDISVPVYENRAAVLEVNAAPGFRMHLEPAEGLPRNVAEPVVDMLFPPGTEGRIPIIAVTGTNGKTTTTRLIAHMVKTMGYAAGYTTSDGIYINNRLVETGDCTGPVSAEFVLKDPTVNYAVLETARGGILRAGLGFTKCDIAVVTNIAADHLGLKGIHTIEDLAKVKSVVPETVVPGGYAVLNADDERVYNMRRNLNCNIALFSMDENNAHVQALVRKGGIACVAENGYVSINKGGWKIRIARIHDIPLTMGGRARFMIENILAAVLACYLREGKVDEIRLALETFIPSPAQTPGRMNQFRFRDFTVLVDYAHNAAGYRALQGFLSHTQASRKTGIIAGVGDRRDEDIRELGSIAAEMFDQIIIRQDRNNRGRTADNIIGLLREGIQSVEAGKPYMVIPSESDAINHAINNAISGEYITVCSDVIPAALEQIKRLKEEEDAAMLNA
jgi:cyanophycin synthetase